MTMMRECKICGEEFRGTAKHNFCSKKCRKVGLRLNSLKYQSKKYVEQVLAMGFSVETEIALILEEGVLDKVLKKKGIIN